MMHVDLSQITSTLDLRDIEDEGTPALIARGAAYAREYARIEDKPAILAANIAVVVLALRKKHDDWRGLSKPYRDDVGALYSASGVSGEQLKRLKGNVRYHVGNLARRYLTPRELRALSLDDASPLEKQQDRRATTAAILRATNASVEAAASAPAKSSKTKGMAAGEEERVPEQRSPGIVVKATADQLRLATVAASLVIQLDPDEVDNMADGQRDKLEEELAAIENAARRLRRTLKKRSSEA
ncbi:hypothetical protein ACF1DV_25840 [Streptomyces achromogenes]|uniref:hypothetical protein n=1 Tax=Streptomyces achromogenes TaxID=67255 RepID=UPI0036FD9C64